MKMRPASFFGYASIWLNKLNCTNKAIKIFADTRYRKSLPLFQKTIILKDKKCPVGITDTIISGNPIRVIKVLARIRTGKNSFMNMFNDAYCV